MTISGERTCFYSFLTTALLVGLYWLGQQIGLPGINEVVQSGPLQQDLKRQSSCLDIGPLSSASL
jgi:hypothetical protein